MRRNAICAAAALLLTIGAGLAPMLLPNLAGALVAGLPLAMLLVFLATVGVLLLSLALAPLEAAHLSSDGRERMPE
jgi:hypothetical protein